MFAVGLMGVLLGWPISVFRAAQEQRMAIRAIENAGYPPQRCFPSNQICYEGDRACSPTYGMPSSMSLKYWLGDDVFLDVTRVELYGKPSTPDPLGPIESFPHLEFLLLNGCGTTDNDLIHLSGLNGLRDLVIIRAEITDAGLAHLAGLPRLRRLNLARCGITDVGLTHLVTLENLKQLNLHGTRVTEAGVAMLRKSLPSLEILR
jgi:hypothetical protein